MIELDLNTLCGVVADGVWAEGVAVGFAAFFIIEVLWTVFKRLADMWMVGRSACVPQDTQDTQADNRRV